MVHLAYAVLLGAASGALAVLARRLPVLGWLMLGPLAAAVYLYSPVAAGLAGLVAGAVASAPPIWGRGPSRASDTLTMGLEAAIWAVAFGVAGWLWPDGAPAWGAVVIPLAALVVSATPRFAAPPGHGGGPRYADAFLASQQGWLPAVHIARLGTDLLLPPLLGLAATVPVMLLVHWPPSPASVLAAAAALLLVAAALAWGWASFGRAVAHVGTAPTLRAAAISVDAPFQTYATSPAYGDVEARIAAFQQQVARSIAAGARLIVLPEHAVFVTAQTRARWFAVVGQWARAAGAVVVTGLFDLDQQLNQLVIVDADGTVRATYEKQHPLLGPEPRRQVRMRPALFRHEPPVSAVICYDANFNDLVRPVARAGGVLAIPANDWKQIADLHYRSAVWPAVMAGVSVIRATGHGISVAYDPAGRLLGKACSLTGPAVLVADLPILRQATAPATSNRSDRAGTRS